MGGHCQMGHFFTALAILGARELRQRLSMNVDVRVECRVKKRRAKIQHLRSGRHKSLKYFVSIFPRKAHTEWPEGVDARGQSFFVDCVDRT